ncbi:MAG TPA: glycine--tRNA ligase subunit beta [Anaerolineaceae bacterium]|nr:glycine--tRNA ligase subunit beta [Anaerolineaceae bacterium]HPN53120.1 glycine--tRNA ligase subunit beta [Anaerolineaceae bacterium]
MAKPLDFQSIMLTLEKFWAEQGCLIWQPYYSQVGAGTMNPATFLRVLGPEPWNVAYVEPSVRPDDGRYGENPNRLQQHYQFQVILKPDPGNPQELYLKSLEALGIDPLEHDIRFVEDNWESPALGAWGLGWEVWLDGQEITQFTYFQQSGGQPVDPVAVEITYGLERIAMALQAVRNFRNIQWSPALTYGDVNLQAEQEHSRYYFEVADVERLRQMYALFEAEAEGALAAGMVLPAHDYILKCSHTFNVLDSRGAVGVTERQALFGRMRDLARRVSEAYLAYRQNLEYPWLKSGSKAAAKPAPVLARPAEKAAPFLFEIGTEELPDADLQSALEQLRARIPALLDELRLSHGPVSIMGTPRRLVAYVEDLAASQPDRTVVIKGPPADRAFDAAGAPTKTAEGFARSKGVAVSDLQVREMDGGRYAAVLKDEPGRGAIEVLAEALPGVIAGIKFDKTMRWNSSNVAFSRPLRWLLALFGEQLIPFSYAGYDSAAVTRGLRFKSPQELPVSSPAAYFAALEGQGIILDPVRRRQTIWTKVQALAAEVGGSVDEDAALLDENTNLVEMPTPMRGSFDPEHLKLPAEVLISVMKKHQRYFPVKKDGALLPYFIIIRNGDENHANVVIDGNEQVVRARFADAAFFVRDDLKHKLSDFLPRLETLTFQKKLGSMLDKSRRISAMMDQLCHQFHLSDEDTSVAIRAAELCKADLVSHMVVEMTALQGTMGRYYAIHSGESQAVAQAIAEHYLPRFAGDATPTMKPGLVVGLADRLDTLSGLFAAGLAPTGTKDPFAQRRAALGLVQALMSWDLDFDLRAGLSLAADHLPLQASDQSLDACFEFISGRMRAYLLEQGIRYDVVDAVMSRQAHNPAGAWRAVKALSAWIAREDWNVILPAYARCVRITRDQTLCDEINPDYLVDPSEQDLVAALEAAETAPRRADSVDEFFAVFMPLIPHINSFFNAVMVMADDENLRANRLAILNRIAGMAQGVADFSLLEGF